MEKRRIVAIIVMVALLATLASPMSTLAATPTTESAATALRVARPAEKQLLDTAHIYGYSTTWIEQKASNDGVVSIKYQLKKGPVSFFAVVRVRKNRSIWYSVNGSNYYNWPDARREMKRFISAGYAKVAATKKAAELMDFAKKNGWQVPKHYWRNGKYVVFLKDRVESWNFSVSIVNDAYCFRANRASFFGGQKIPTTPGRSQEEILRIWIMDSIGNRRQ